MFYRVSSVHPKAESYLIFFPVSLYFIFFFLLWFVVFRSTRVGSSILPYLCWYLCWLLFYVTFLATDIHLPATQLQLAICLIVGVLVFSGCHTYFVLFVFPHFGSTFTYMCSARSWYLFYERNYLYWNLAYTWDSYVWQCVMFLLLGGRSGF